MCPSGRLFDNSSKLHAIGRKFLHAELSHQYLDRVRRWERSVKKWLSYRKNYRKWPDHWWEEVQGFFHKNFLWLFTTYISLLSFMRSTCTSPTPVPWRYPSALICCTMGYPLFEVHIALGFQSEVSALIYSSNCSLTVVWKTTTTLTRYDSGMILQLTDEVSVSLSEIEQDIA